jgi:methyl-accepting chemotaxis protein
MALVKASRLATPVKPTAQPDRGDPAGVSEPSFRAKPRRQQPISRQAQASERIAAATEELASGLAESAAAAEELRRAMQQIASGADEAAGASREQLAAIDSIVANLGTSRLQSEASHRRTEAVRSVLGDASSQMTISIQAVERNADRQQAALTMISELDRNAQNIGEISRAVSEISDQTNLLALNAAIEAARAGDHGRGFAVVAEEVRALAETSEKSAREVRGFAEAIQDKVREVVEAARTAAEGAVAEAKAGLAVVGSLDKLRGDTTQITSGSQDTLSAMAEAERAATEARRGAEQIARAAEEQSTAAAEAQTAIEQQVRSLEQSQAAAQSLAELAEALRAGRADTGAPQQIGAAAEQLSAAVQELSGASSQIMAAVEQINRGAEQQSAATTQISDALSQIQNSAAVAERNARTASERVTGILATLRDNRSAVENLAEGVRRAIRETTVSLDLIRELAIVSRRIDKLVDAIALVAVQTSMLAVSGSVEAARAGDSGRGFAVVSNEIRGLARKTTESMDGIKDMVRSIVDQVASVHRDLEEINVLLEAEVQKSRIISEALARSDTEVAALSSANGVVLQGAEAIVAALTQAAQGSRQIAAAAEQSNAASRQAASASAEQAQGAEDLAAAIEEIASLADELGQPNA